MSTLGHERRPQRDTCTDIADYQGRGTCTDAAPPRGPRRRKQERQSWRSRSTDEARLQYAGGSAHRRPQHDRGYEEVRRRPFTRVRGRHTGETRTSTSDGLGRVRCLGYDATTTSTSCASTRARMAGSHKVMSNCRPSSRTIAGFSSPSFSMKRDGTPPRDASARHQNPSDG